METDQQPAPQSSPDNTTPPNLDQPTEAETLNFEFLGTGREFFSIWVVNVFLSIVTLGIFSAWAKVRTERYFYGNTRLDGRAFSYLADPVKILKGRLVAFSLLILYSMAWNFYPQAGMILLVIGVLLLPAILVAATRFRLRYSAYRNIRFSLECRFSDAYRAFAVPVTLILVITTISYLLMQLIDFEALAASFQPEGQDDQSANIVMTAEDWIPTLFYLILLPFIPWIDAIRARVLISHTGFGDLRASIGARIRSFYRVYVVTFVLMMAMGSLVGIIIGVGAVVIGALGLTFPPELIGISVFLAVLLFYGSMFFASGYFRAERTNLIYGTTRFSNHRLRSNLQFKAVGWLFLSNTIAIIFSLGLLIPYAQIRMTRYQLGMMSLQATNLDQITANNQHEEGALGESMIDAFDLDIGL